MSYRQTKFAVTHSHSEGSPKVSISVLSYNSSEFLQSLFESLRKTTYPNYELIVVDNASSDNSPQIIEEWQKKTHFKYIQSGNNLGYSGGHKLAIEAAQGELFVLLNPDLIVTPDWLDKLVKHALNPKVGIVGGVNAPWHLKNAIDFKELARIHPKPVKAHMVSGSLFLFKRELLDKLGMLDHDYFLYWEDSDYCYKAYLLGYDVIFANDVYYFHYSGGSTGIRSQKDRKLLKKSIAEKKINAVFYYYRNELLFYLTDFQWWNTLVHLPRPFFRAIYHLIFKFNPVIISSLLQGIRWLWQNRKLVVQKRRKIQAIRTRSDKEFFKRRREKDRVAAGLRAYYKKLESKVEREKMKKNDCCYSAILTEAKHLNRESSDQ